MSREEANDEDFLQCPKASLGVVIKYSRKEAKLDMKRPAVVAAKALRFEVASKRHVGGLNYITDHL